MWVMFIFKMEESGEDVMCSWERETLRIRLRTGRNVETWYFLFLPVVSSKSMIRPGV